MLGKYLLQLNDRRVRVRSAMKKIAGAFSIGQVIREPENIRTR